MKVKEESEKVDLTLNTYHDAAKKIERNSKKKKKFKPKKPIWGAG